MHFKALTCWPFSAKVHCKTSCVLSNCHQSSSGH